MTLTELLQGVTGAHHVEAAGRGLTREQRWHPAQITEHRILQAVRAGATSADVGNALGVGLSRARERIARARRAEAVTIERRA